MTKSTLPLILGIIAIGAFVLMQLRGSQAATPPLFDGSATTLAAALSEAGESGRPVLAVATADWCPPCQTYKRAALASDRVAQAAAAKVVPIMLDVTDRNGPFSADAASLGVSTIPATFLLAPDGTVLARATGAVREAELVAMIDDAARAVSAN